MEYMLAAFLVVEFSMVEFAGVVDMLVPFSVVEFAGVVYMVVAL